ncbi:lantibiotic dehydratase [Sphaerisporangium flaviroseum]|uniref:Lantibiotic dehydratase n=1 Tax=Sphaerisporangium flaviroseum TaxID=509199 RepID=A0ABP7J909_9ACTN
MVSFRAGDAFLLRTPALPVGRITEILAMCPWQAEHEELSREWEDLYATKVLELWRLPLVAAAIRLAAPDLAGALDRVDALSDKDRRRAVMSLGRYLNRMSVRATPLGLMAGVAGGGFGDSAGAVLGQEAIGALRVRADMGWIMHLARQAAGAASASADFLVRANDLLYESRGRLWLPGADTYGAGDNRVVDIRLTRPVRAVLDQLRVPRTVGALRAHLTEAFPAAAPEKIDGLLDQLLELGILTSAWRPRLTNGPEEVSPVPSLGGIADDGTAQALRSVEETIESFHRTGDLHQAGQLVTRAQEAASGHDGSVLSIDAHLSVVERPVLPREVQTLAEEAVRILSRIQRIGAYPEHLREYANAFTDHYGSHAEVPLLEVLTAETGLGPPNGYRNPPRAYPLAGAASDGGQARGQDVLARLVATALARGARTVELDDQWMAELADAADGTGDSRPPASVTDVCMQLLPPGDDHPSWRAVLGLYSLSVGGRMSARFHDMLDQRTRQAFRDLAREEEERLAPYLAVELTYLPLQGRYANIAMRPCLLGWELPVNVTPGVPDERVITLEDVLVSVGHHGRLRLRSARLSRDLHVTQNTQLNPLLAPNVCRFLVEVSRAFFRPMTVFDWGTLGTDMPFLPRVTRGDLVLRRARWRLRRADAPPGGAGRGHESLPAFARAVREWRELWKVPRRVQLTEADNCILLDLDSAPSLEELRLALIRLRDKSATLEEVLPGPGDGFVQDAQGERYTAEVVVPVVAGAEPVETRKTEAEPASSARALASRRDRLRTVGSDWLYVKLYAERPAHDTIITGEVAELSGDLTRRYGVGHPFFLRYVDPDHHLRLRFHVPQEGTRAGVLGDVAGWAGRLTASGLLKDYSFATYSREIERYGGPALIEHAESLFRHDSAAVTLLLRHLTGGKTTLDRVPLTVLSLEWVTRLMVPSFDERRSLAAGAAGNAGGTQYRVAGRPLWEALVGPGPDQTLMEEVADLWQGPATAYMRRLDEVTEAGELWSDRRQIIRSVLHMHCNRMGLTKADEAVAYGMWRRLLDRMAHSRDRPSPGGTR